jgi:hypothetical protein
VLRKRNKGNHQLRCNSRRLRATHYCSYIVQFKTVIFRSDVIFVTGAWNLRGPVKFWNKVKQGAISCFSVLSARKMPVFYYNHKLFKIGTVRMTQLKRFNLTNNKQIQNFFNRKQPHIMIYQTLHFFFQTTGFGMPIECQCYVVELCHSQWNANAM